ncbi:hypothetical protein [Pseudomonas corrugata]|uniref:hypothetical protein n=1 Tax=Pseudomonas corrugata TaxID=47879 RepID=UPI002234D228|nr:hypothetical protein [Pseudomonas corrugata]UZE07261.1 hypothetical protein LOY65_04860 [Pseudomonas corrugata]
MTSPSNHSKPSGSRLQIIIRSSTWASYEVILTLMPVLIWIFIIAFSTPTPQISLEFPAFSFFCVSIWAACLRETPRAFNGGSPAQDKFERECSMTISILGFVTSLICLVFSAQKSTGLIQNLWGPFTLTVGIAGGLGIIYLFTLISIKIQRTEYGHYQAPDKKQNNKTTK